MSTLSCGLTAKYAELITLYLRHIQCSSPNMIILHWNQFYELYIRVNHPVIWWRLFHFLSQLFLDLCVCVQNNKLCDAVLVRGNAGRLANEKKYVFHLLLSSACHSMRRINMEFIARSSSFGTLLLVWLRQTICTYGQSREKQQNSARFGATAR